MQKTSSPATAAPAFRPGLALLAAATAILCVGLALAGYTQPVVMGVVQGLAEFLPISSSAHLLLVPWFFGWTDEVIKSRTFDVALHLGTLIAVVVYFWRDWIELLRSAPGLLGWAARRAGGDRSVSLTNSQFLLALVIIATIPGGVAGILTEKPLDSWLETDPRAPLLFALTLPVFGLILYFIDRRWPERRGLDQSTWRDSLLIGVAQACALIPGVSRSGGTITMSRYLSFDRSSAARFSFLLSAPITAAAVLFKLKDILPHLRDELAVFTIGVFVSGAVGALAIGGLLNYIRRAGFGIFAIYRVALAVLIVLIYIMR